MKTKKRTAPRMAILVAAIAIAAALLAAFARPTEAAAQKIPADWVTLAKESYAYTGVAVCPTPTVANGAGKKLVAGTDYSVTYANNTLPGTATVTVKGKGGYSGTVKKTFKIALAGKKLLSVKANSNGGLCVKWKRGLGAADGYQMQVSASPSFGEIAYSRTFTETPYDSAYCTANPQKGLSKGTLYYVRLRTYVRIGGKTYKSKWSAALSARTASQTPTPSPTPSPTPMPTATSLPTATPKPVPTATPKPKIAEIIDEEAESEEGESNAGVRALPTVSLSTGKVFYKDSEKRNVQGICTDGRYLYIACREGGDSAEVDAMPTTLKKIRVEDGEVVKENSSTCYCHANGMAYCPLDGKIYIATLGRTENAAGIPKNQQSVQKYGTVAVVDKKTLACDRLINVNEELQKARLGAIESKRGSWVTVGGAEPKWVNIWETLDAPVLSQVNWDDEEKCFVCQVRPYRRQSGDDAMHGGIARFTYHWQLIDFQELPSGLYSGNMVRDQLPDVPCFWYMAKNSDKTMTVLLSFDGKWSVAQSVPVPTKTSHEMENFALIGDELYVTFNTKPITIERYKLRLQW